MKGSWWLGLALLVCAWRGGSAQKISKCSSSQVCVRVRVTVVEVLLTLEIIAFQGCLSC
jgi:hypothetical protein